MGTNPESFFSAVQPRGRLRLGMSDDLALTRLPQILRDFRRDNPLVDLDLTVDQSGSRTLAEMRQYERSTLAQAGGVRRYLDSLRRTTYVWVNPELSGVRAESTPPAP